MTRFGLSKTIKSRAVIHRLPASRRIGHGCTEAPRGICYHRYQIGGDGLIKKARIVPPTSQNQKAIEVDLKGTSRST